MNLAALWSITGATIDRRQRAIIVSSWAAMTALAFVFARASALVVPMIAYSVGMGFWWAFVTGRALLLQRDARVLRLPDVDVLVVGNLLIQYAATALLPALIMAIAARTDFARMAALFSCIAAGALMFQTLPRFLAMLFSIVPSSLQLLNARGLIPGLTDPGFVSFGWGLAAAMLAVALWRWRSILAANPGTFGRWSMPLVIQMQQRAARCENLQGWESESNASSDAARTGLHRQLLLGGISAQTPTRALRVWLGGTFAPVPWRLRAVQVAFVLLPMLVPILFYWFTGGTIAGWMVFTVVAVGTIVPLVTMSAAPARLQRLYSDPGGELALLALLPGIGAAAAKRSLLSAALGVPLAACACLYLFALLACIGAGGNGPLIAALTLSTTGAIAFGVVQSVTIAAGTRIPRPALHAAFMLGITLLCTTPVLLPLSGDTPAFGLAGASVIFGWATFFALVGWLGLRAARALARRPHGFLLNDY